MVTTCISGSLVYEVGPHKKNELLYFVVIDTDSSNNACQQDLYVRCSLQAAGGASLLSKLDEKVRFFLRSRNWLVLL